MFVEQVGQVNYGFRRNAGHDRGVLGRVFLQVFFVQLEYSRHLDLLAVNQGHFIIARQGRVDALRRIARAAFIPGQRYGFVGLLIPYYIVAPEFTDLFRNKGRGLKRRRHRRAFTGLHHLEMVRQFGQLVVRDDVRGLQVFPVIRSDQQRHVRIGSQVILVIMIILDEQMAHTQT